MMRSWVLRACVCLGLLWCVLLWVRFGNAPLCHGRGDFASYPPTLFAWNHLRHGLGVTLGRQIRNLEDARPDELVTYTSHPGVTVLLAAASFWALGHLEPWAGRVAPALATVLAAWVLFRLARACGGGTHAAFTAALFTLFPITNLHGTNICYQPYMVLGLACTLLCAQKGWHWRALLSVCLWGLVDFAALYPAPWLALRALRSDLPILRRVARALAAAGTCAVVLGTHVVFLLITDGDLTGGSGRPVSEYILQVVQGGGAAAPEWGEFLTGQWHALQASFTWAGVGLGACALLLRAVRFTFAEWVLLATGVLEVLIFRAHAHWHEFWWQYASPFMALAGGRVLAWAWDRDGSAGPWLRLGALLGLSAVAAEGAVTSLAFWRARDNPQVRRVADQVGQAADPREVVFLFEPEGWTVEYYRQHPVGTSTFLLPKDFMEVIRRVGGDCLALHRPIALWVEQQRVDEGASAFLRERFPDVRPKTVVASSERGEGIWLRYDIGVFLRDPSRSPVVAALEPAKRAEYVAVARRLQILTALQPGESVAVRDGLMEAAQMHMRRGLFSHDATPFTTSWRLKGPLYAVAWPGTPGVTELAQIYPGRPREPRPLVLPEQTLTLELVRLVP